MIFWGWIAGFFLFIYFIFLYANGTGVKKGILGAAGQGVCLVLAAPCGMNGAFVQGTAGEHRGVPVPVPVPIPGGGGWHGGDRDSKRHPAGGSFWGAHFGAGGLPKRDAPLQEWGPHPGDVGGGRM